MRNRLMFCFCSFMAAFHIIVIQAALYLNESVAQPTSDAMLWMAAAIWFALEVDEQRAQAQTENKEINS